MGLAMSGSLANNFSSQSAGTCVRSMLAFTLIGSWKVSGSGRFS